VATVAVWRLGGRIYGGTDISTGGHAGHADAVGPRVNHSGPDAVRRSADDAAGDTENPIAATTSDHTDLVPAAPAVSGSSFGAAKRKVSSTFPMSSSGLSARA
jgi:hypothetical protein